MTQIPWDETGLFLAVDTESSGFHADDGAFISVVSMAWGPDPDQAVALPFAQRWDMAGDPSQLTLDVEPDINLQQEDWDRLLAWLQQQRLIMHNGAHDLALFAMGAPRGWEGVALQDALYWDTMLAEGILRPKAEKALKVAVVERGLYTEAQAKDDIVEWLKAHKVKRYDHVPWDVMEPYAKDDATMTWRLWREQADQVAEGHPGGPWIRREIRIARVLAGMEQRGVGYDAKTSLEIAEALETEADKIGARLPFRPTLPAAKAYFYGPKSGGGLGLIPYDVTDAGNPRLTDGILEQMVQSGQGGEAAKDLREMRRYAGASSMWYRAYGEATGEDGRIRCRYKQGKVVSTRFSVSRINLQSIPHAYQLGDLEEIVQGRYPRSLFQTKPGHEVWEVDLAQAELRVAAAYAECERHLQAIQDGKDVHGETARMLFNVEPEDDDWKMYRNIAKRSNFSLIFDVGPSTFARTLKEQAGLELPRGEVEHIVNRWKSLHPEYKHMLHRVERAVIRRGWIRLRNGYQRWFRDWEFNNTHKAWNQLVQGSIAQFVADWMLYTDERWPGTILLNVHDSMILEIPKEQVAGQIADVRQWASKEGEALFGVATEVDAENWLRKS